MELTEDEKIRICNALLRSMWLLDEYGGEENEEYAETDIALMNRLGREWGLYHDNEQLSGTGLWR